MQPLLVGLIVGLVAPPTQTSEPNLPAAPSSMEPRPGLLRHCGPTLVQSRPRFRYAAHGASRLPTHPAGVIALIRALGGRPYGVAVARNGTTYVALIGS